MARGRPRSTWSRNIDRSYPGTENSLGRLGNDDFQHHRKAAIKHLEQVVEAVKRTLAFYAERIEAWRYAPEALKDHETVVRERKAASEAEKAEKLFRANWKRAWNEVAHTIASHKQATEYVQSIYPGTNPEIRKRIEDQFRTMWGHLPPFPSDKERAAARKGGEDDQHFFVSAPDIGKAARALATRLRLRPTDKLPKLK